MLKDRIIFNKRLKEFLIKEGFEYLTFCFWKLDGDGFYIHFHFSHEKEDYTFVIYNDMTNEIGKVIINSLADISKLEAMIANSVLMKP